jgi:hypothetical protein
MQAGKPALQWFVLCSILFSSPTFAAKPATAPPPPATYNFPLAAQPGQTTRLTFSGDDLGKPASLWTSFPATVKHDESKPNDFELTLPSDSQVGINAIRLVTSTGVRGLQFFMIDDLPTLKIDEAKTHSPQDAPNLAPGSALDGTSQPLAAQYFRIDGKKGERMSVEVVAQRLGSRMDPMVRLLDPDGRELVYCDDTPGIGSDCRFSWRFATDGTYLLELRDANYEGGPQYFYRLRLGDFPLVTAPFPLAGKGGTTHRFTFDGPPGDTIDALEVALPSDSSRMPLGLNYPNGRGSGFVSILCADEDDFVASAPNHFRDTAATVALPTAISGRFTDAGQRDFYRIEAGRGQRITITGQTRSLGSGVDLLLRLLKPDGSPIATSNATTSDEGTLSAKFPDSGSYLLEISDIDHTAGPGRLYRLTINTRSADFSLSTDTEKVTATAGKPFHLKLACTRPASYDGPVELSLTGPASSFTLRPAKIPPSVKEADLEITPPADFDMQGPIHFSILGTARIDGQEISHPASTLPAIQKLYPRVFFLPPDLDGLIGLGVRKDATDEH